MGNRSYTPEDIFSLIDRRLVNRDAGIKLIKNYGLRNQLEVWVEIQKEFGGYSTEVDEIVSIISAQLDAMLDAAVEALAEAQ